jgi:hypothetical protein
MIQPYLTLLGRARDDHSENLPVKLFDPAQLEDAITPYLLKRISEHISLSFRWSVRCVEYDSGLGLKEPDRDSFACIPLEKAIRHPGP